MNPAPRFEESAGAWIRAMTSPVPNGARAVLSGKTSLTVVSAAILISAEVFGAAFAGSWAIANLLALGTIGARMLDGLFVLCGIVVMVQFVRAARRVEPFTDRLKRSRLARGAARKCSADLSFKTKTLAQCGCNSLLAKLPNFARACGRVSVGGHPDKRPDSRLRKRLYFLAPATGSRRRTGNASSPLATRLKATTEGLFWLLPAPMPGTPKGLVHLCQQCGTGFPSSGPRQQSR